MLKLGRYWPWKTLLSHLNWPSTQNGKFFSVKALLVESSCNHREGDNWRGDGITIFH